MPELYRSFQFCLTIPYYQSEHHISRRIQFGLFPFRSPLLGKSLLISLPHGTKMLQFPWFDFQRYVHWNAQSARLSFGDLGIFGYMRLPRAYRSLSRPSSLLKPSNPPIAVFTPANSATYYTTMHDDHHKSFGGTCYTLHTSLS